MTLMFALLSGILAACASADQAAPPESLAEPSSSPSGASSASAGAASPSASGAASPGAASPATSAAAGTVSTEGVSNKFAGTTLNMVTANHAWQAAMQPLLPAFEQASGMRINLTSYGEDQLSNQLTVRFTSGSGDIDVFMFRPLQEGRLFASNGWLADMSGMVQGSGDWNWEDFQQPARGTVTFNDKVYGVPIVTEREILYYRKDLFDAKGIAVPKTLDELMAAAQKLHDPSNNMFGFVARGQRAPAVTQFSSFLYSMGGEWTNNGKSAVGTPEATKAYQFYGDLLNKYGAPGVLNMSWPQAIGIFGQGQAAMYTDADSLYPNLLDPTKSTVTDKVGYAVFPAGPAGSKPYNVTSWALGVSEASQNKDAAFEFVKWATSQPVVAQLQKGGLPGARTSVWESPDGTAGFPKELAQVIQESAKVGVDHDRPLVINVGQARDIVGGPIVTAIQGQDVQAAVQEADQAFNQFLQQEGSR
jgi:multiple sugar transport system substrate-binding protein